jgi:hypothetical protein
MFNLPRCGFGWLVGAAFLVTAGCNNTPALPKTFPVTGTVAYQGGQLMKGGSIQLKSAADPDLRVVGAIKDDGTFTLRTIKDSATGAGVPDGEYSVIVQPPAIADTRGGVQGKGAEPISLTEKIKVEAKANTLNIVVPNPHP